MTLVLASGSGCVTAPKPPPTHVQRLSMDPLQFKARRDAQGKLVIEQHDAQALFDRAGVAFEEGRFLDAIPSYASLLKDFADSELAAAARYNLALTHEKAGQYDEAVRLYEVIIHADPAASDALDALFQIAACREAQERWLDADAVLATILTRPKLGDRDLLEATVRRGHAMFALERLDEAETLYRTVLKRRRGGGEPRAQYMSRPHFAQAQFGVGRIEHKRFDDQPIRLPQDVMDRDIENKAATFLRAQAAYLRAMSYKELEISSGALLSIGRLYEEFYDDFMSAPLPKELANQHEIDVYLLELKKKIRPLIQRAVYVHKRNLRFATRLGEKHELVGRTRDHLDRLTKLLDSIPVPEPPSQDEDGKRKTARKSADDIVHDGPSK